MKLTKTIRGRNLNVILTVADDFEGSLNHYKIKKATYKMKDYPGNGILLHWDGHQLEMWIEEGTALNEAIRNDIDNERLGIFMPKTSSIFYPGLITIPVIEQNYLTELRKRMAEAGDKAFKASPDDLEICFDLDGNIRRIDSDKYYDVIKDSPALKTFICEIIDYSLKHIIRYSFKSEHGAMFFRMTIGQLKEVYESHTAEKITILEKAQQIIEKQKQELEDKVKSGVVKK